MISSSSRHLVDPELLGLLETWPTIALNTEVLPLMRDAARLPIPEDEAVAAKVGSSSRFVPGPKDAPDVELLSYRSKSATGLLPCIFHIHGGGYVVGAAASLAPVHRALVDKLGCVLTSVEYRLAPETRFPGAVEDCYAALSWLFANAEAMGVDISRIGVMGESAGGGLAAALALLVRDRGEYRLAFQHLIYPMLDDRTCVSADPHAHAGEYIWTPHNNAFGWEALLGCAPGSDGVSPYAAAARAEQLEGLPPTFISTGALDLFVDEDMDYARRLMRAGVPTELHAYPGAFHGFDFDPMAAVSATARRDSLAALSKALNQPI